MVSDKKIKSVRAIFRKNFGKSYFAEITKTNDFSEVHAKLNDAIKEAKGYIILRSSFCQNFVT